MSDIFQTIHACMNAGMPTMMDEDKKFYGKQVHFRTFHTLQEAKRFARQDGPQLIQVGNTCMPVRDLVMARIVDDDHLEVQFVENADTAKWLGPEFVLRLVINPAHTQDILAYFCDSERGNWKSDWTGTPF